MVGRGKGGWTTSKRGHPCPCYRTAHKGLLQKKTGTGRQYLLNGPSCHPHPLPPDDPVGSRNWTECPLMLAFYWWVFVVAKHTVLQKYQMCLACILLSLPPPLLLSLISSSPFGHYQYHHCLVVLFSVHLVLWIGEWKTCCSASKYYCVFDLNLLLLSRKAIDFAVH